VAVGRAIVRNPKAFLFDEPLSNLDAKLRVETRAEIKKLHLRLQTTTIYVTHDQEEAMTLGDRIVVMKDGIIHQCAPPLEVYERPVNRFVAGFVGTPPMNFIKIMVQPGGITFANQRIKMPERFGAKLGSSMGKEMVLGVRPESLCPGNTGKFAGIENSISAKVVVMEPLGDKVDLYLSLGDGQNDVMDKLLVCRADAHEFGKIRANDIITLFVDLSRVHVFEPGDNGMNVSLSQESGHAAA
jgi:multiple sugar transport system ATP-binding protein